MKISLKKICSAALSTVLLCGALTGCGGQTPAADAGTAKPAVDGKYSGIKLVYWSNWEATEPQGVVITQAAREFEAETGAVVDLQFKGRTGIKEGLIPALDADQQVDMFDGMGNKSNFGDRIICLEELVQNRNYEKDTNPAMMDLCRNYYEDGKLYEIPYQIKASAYMYNKDLFAQAGIEKVPGTDAEFLEVCEQLKIAGIIPVTTDDAYAMQAFGMHLARLMGNDEVKKTVSMGLWDRPEVLKTAQFFEQMAVNGYFSPQIGSNVWPTGQNTELATGRAAMYCVGTYVVNETKSITGPDFNWGFFGYPNVDGGINGQEAMVIGCQTFGITSKCEHPEAAFELIEKLTRGKWDQKLAAESLSLPADRNNNDWPEQLMEAKPYMDSCTEIFGVSGGLESNPDITPALKENLMKLYAGKITAEQFVANLNAASHS